MIYEYLLLNDNMGLEELLENACRNREIPGAVLVANGPNRFHYENAFGTVSLSDDGKAPALTTEATFWIASCTKLMTTIAAMQCVERGIFTLDEDISKFLPEFKDIEILTGFDSVTKAPVLEKNTTPVTMRHLLTHSSGVSYDHFSPPLQKWLAHHNRYPSNGRTGLIREKYRFPLLFAPGTSFEYGAGIDWAGQMIERATSQSLSSFLKSNVWERLGMTSCTFRPSESEAAYNCVMAMAQRDGLVNPIFGTTMSPDAKVIKSETKHPRDVKVSDDYGGAGCFCSAPDYAKMLDSICKDDGRLLKSDSVKQMFSPQLSAQSKERLGKLLSFPEVNNSMGGLPPAEDSSQGGMDWGLGGQMTPVGVEGRRKKGTMFWGGLPNLFWWIDRESGVSGIFATQLMPTGDPKCVELMGKFESAVYQAVDLERKGNGRGRL